MTTCCPDCLSPVAARPDAREGRCACVNSKWQQFMDDHNTRNVTQ